MPRSLLNKYREGLLLTSACEAGELYRAIVDGTSYEELKKSPPITISWRSSRWATTPIWCATARWTARSTIKDFNRTVIKLGEDLHKPVVATGDVHFRSRRMPSTAPSCRRATALRMPTTRRRCSSAPPTDMLAQFSYLPQEKAYEIVVTNPNKIAATIDNNVRAIPAAPTRQHRRRRAAAARCTWETPSPHYGDPLPEVVEKRLQKELDSICGHGYAVLYVIAVKLVAYSNAGGYQVGSRGSVGSSAVAHFSGISEVNRLPPPLSVPQLQAQRVDHRRQRG